MPILFTGSAEYESLRKVSQEARKKYRNLQHQGQVAYEEMIVTHRQQMAHPDSALEQEFYSSQEDNSED